MRRRCARWAPRFFARGGAAAAFSGNRFVAREGSPDAYGYPDIQPVRVNEADISGQGSTTEVTVNTLTWSAGAGVAFTVDAGERRIRIKPSVEYFSEEVRMRGTVSRVVEIFPIADENFNCGFPFRTERPGGQGDPYDPNRQFRCINLNGTDTKRFHGIGPGLELELDAARAGPVMLTVYAKGAAYRFFGDLSLVAEDSNQYGESAFWYAEKERWAYQGGVGLRFRWIPE